MVKKRKPTARTLTILFHAIGVTLLVTGAASLISRGEIMLAIIPVGSALGLIGSLIFDLLAS